MATQWQTFPIEFSGGLISNISPLQHGANAVGSATILQNFEPSKEGGYRKIRGYEKFDTNTVPGVNEIFGVKVINNSEVLAIRSDGTKSQVYQSTGNGWTKLQDASSVDPFANIGDKVTFVDLNFGAGHKVLLADGVNYPAVFDDTASTVTPIDSLADVQGAEYIAVFKATVFYSKGTNLYFTAPSTYDDFSAANGGGVINVAHQITGLAVFRDQLIVFCRNSIKRITGTSISDFVVYPITDTIGCINGHTIQEVGGDIMYASPDGLRLLSATERIGDFALDVASDRINKDAYSFLQTGELYCSIVLREKAQYRIFSYVENEQRETSKGLLATKTIAQGGSGFEWATIKGIKAYTADSKYTENSSETVIFANADGYVYELETNPSFDGNIIEAIYESPYMPITDPQVRKTFYKMTLYAEPDGIMELDFNLRFDFNKSTDTGLLQPNTIQLSSTGNSVFIFGASNAYFGKADAEDPTQVETDLAEWPDYDPSLSYATFGGELDKVYNKNVIGSGKTVAIRIEDSSSNPSFTLDTMLLEFRQNDRQ